MPFPPYVSPRAESERKLATQTKFMYDALACTVLISSVIGAVYLMSSYDIPSTRSESVFEKSLESLIQSRK